MQGRNNSAVTTRAPIDGLVHERPLIQLLTRVVGHDLADRITETRREKWVARRLRRLSNGWTVINDLGLRALDNNVDHLVVGPGGIFCLTTSDHRGKTVWVAEDTIRVNNFPVDHLSKARAASRAVQRDLGSVLGRDLHVHTVVVVLTDDLTIRTQPLGGSVVEARRICSWLQRKRPVLSVSETAMIAGAIQQPATWAGEPLSRT